jgi:endonuclease/exonuclease/phosphatase family metal-dependent hydrolase
MPEKRTAFRAVPFFLFILVFGAVAHAETLTVATYNVENYGPADRITEAGFRPDYPKPESEKRALRRVIHGLNADVLALQEMGGSAHLEELRRDLRSEGLDYPHAVLASASDANRHVALLSKRPLIDATTHTDLTFAYLGARETVKRGLLEASVSTATGKITIFVVHLKSRFTDAADDPSSAVRRGAEASAIRDRVLQRFPTLGNTRFLIVGDCNDGKTSKAVAHLQKRGKTEVAELLPAVDSRGEAWTHAYRREESYSRVDHIFAAPGLVAAVKGGAARIYDGDGVRQASDHRPVLVTLDLEKER